jgi:hypothetical protein
MKIRNATETEIKEALDQAQPFFENNLQFNAFSALDIDIRAGEIDVNNLKVTKWRVTIAVINKELKGHSLYHPTGYYLPDRINTACWHVHQKFYEFLPDSASVFLGRDDIGDAADGWIWRAQVPKIPTWKKWEIYVHELCECFHQRERWMRQTS